MKQPYLSVIVTLRLPSGREYPCNVKAEIAQLVKTGAEIIGPTELIPQLKRQLKIN